MIQVAVRRVARFGAVAIVLLGAAPTAQAQVVDQEQPVITTDGNLALGGYYNQQLAQVFTAGGTGLLGAVEFPLECSSYDTPAGTITLEVRSVESGMPADTVLSTTTFHPGAFPPFWPNDFPPYLRRLTLSASLPVTAGVQYALVLQFASPNETNCAVASGPEGDPYAGGDGWYRENGPWGWVPLALGSRFDMPFRTLMQEESRTSVFHKDQWICIDRSSLDDHLAHGDTVWMPGCRR